MPSRSASLVIAALWASGCFHPTYDHPACGSGGACPDGLTCNPQGICDSAGPGGPGGSGGSGSPGSGGGLAGFRLIAPMSLSTVTQRQPTLRWLQTPGDGTPTVELCKDRACTAPLGIATVMAANRLSAPQASTWTGTGARRIDLTSPDGDNAFFGTSLAQLAPARPAGTMRSAVTLARPAHGKPSSYWR